MTTTDPFTASNLLPQPPVLSTDIGKAVAAGNGAHHYDNGHHDIALEAGQHRHEIKPSHKGGAFADGPWTKHMIEPVAKAHHYGNGHGDTQPEPSTAPSTEMEFWGARPVLRHIHTFALSRLVSPWAVLGTVLSRVVAATPAHVGLPPLIGGRGSLNLITALVAPSGIGKGGAVAVAEDAIRLGHGAHLFRTDNLGTGQGIAHCYGKREKDGTLTRQTDSVLFLAAEVDHITANSKQTGSTLLAELRCLYSGENLGHAYADATKRVQIPKHTYRGCVVICAQPERAGTLIDDDAIAGGTPQRIVWLPATYQHPEVAPDEPTTRWEWKSPTWLAPALNGQLPANDIIGVCDTAVNEIHHAHLARQRGDTNAIDGHRLYTQEKIAAALAILDTRKSITDADWSLAAVIMAMSDRTRATIAAALTTGKQRRNTDRAHAEATRALIVEDKLTEHKVKRVTRLLLAKLPDDPPGVARSALYKQLPNRDRPYLDGALAALVTTAAVATEPGRTAGSVRYYRSNPTAD